MTRSQQISVPLVVDTVAFLCRQGESDHAGEGVTAGRVAEEFPFVQKTVAKYLRQAVEAGDLDARPAVRPGEEGTMNAYTPAE